MLFTKFRDQGSGDTLSAAAVGKHFAQHGAEPHNQGQTAKRTADTGFDGADDFIQRHSLHQPDSERYQDKGDKPVHFEADHQKK